MDTHAATTTTTTTDELGPVLPLDKRMGAASSLLSGKMQEYILSLDAPALHAYIRAFYAKLIVPGYKQNMPPLQLVQALAPRLGYSLDVSHSDQQVDDYINYCLTEIQALQRGMMKMKLFDNDVIERVPYATDMAQMLAQCGYMMVSFTRSVAVWQRMRIVADGIDANDVDPVATQRLLDVGKLTAIHPPSFGFVVGDGTPKNTDFQEVVLYSLSIAQEKGYRKYGDFVYQRISVPVNGQQVQTHAWKEVMSLEQFVKTCCPKEFDIKMWRHMTTRTSTAGDVAKYLSGCIDQELPQLVKDRHVFAFTNGTYVTCCQRPDGTIGDVFVPYNQQQEDGLHLGEGIAAANFFEVQLEYMDHCKWVDIPTPNLDRILNTQQLKPEVMRWMYVFIGRLLYALNEKDKWQVIPFLKGVGGCGKSTLINDVCGQLYFHTDTGNLSNNIEKRFGLSALVDKLVYLAAEIKNDFQLEQAEFQQMVSGDEVTINIKHQTARSVAWRIPGMLAGNELPGWVDNSSSIARRVVIFYFPHHVANEKGDSDLGTKLRAELGNIIQKCNRAYLQAVHQVGTDNVWMHLPKYFKDQQQVLRMETNSMEHYLASNLLVFGPDKYIPYCAFQVKYKDYCRVNSLTMKAFNNTNMDTTFSRYSLHKGTHVESMRYPPNSATTLETTFLHGVDEVPTNVTIDDEAGMAF